jgi:hypothetical protein
LPMEHKQKNVGWFRWWLLVCLRIIPMQWYLRIIFNTNVWSCKMDVWPSFTLPEPIQKWTISKELYVPALKQKTANLSYAKGIEKGFDWKPNCEAKKPLLANNDFERIKKGLFDAERLLKSLKRLDNWE